MFTGPVIVGVGGHQVRPGHVAHLDPVAGLSAVAEHGRPPTLDQPPAEDRDYAGLAVNVLAGSVDVAITQRHRR